MSTLSRIWGIVALFFACVSSMAGDHNTMNSDFCIHYYGDLRPEVVVTPQSASLNQSADICSSVLSDGLAWQLRATSGVVLTMCPVSEYTNNTDGAVMVISLERKAPLDIDDALTDITFEDILVTNNSRHGPFEGGRVPGNVSQGRQELRWDIDGTHAAIDPKSDAGAELRCPEEPQHKARHNHCYRLDKTFLSSEACWPYQNIKWATATDFNFSIKFGNTYASARFELEAKWSLDGTKAKTVYSTTTLAFSGQMSFPSVVDYDFWKNTTVPYEDMRRSHTSIKWIRDSDGWPAFYNGSNRAWYAARNQTYGKWEGGGTRTPPSLVLLFGVLLLPFVL